MATTLTEDNFIKLISAVDVMAGADSYAVGQLTGSIQDLNSSVTRLDGRCDGFDSALSKIPENCFELLQSSIASEAEMRRSSIDTETSARIYNDNKLQSAINVEDSRVNSLVSAYDKGLTPDSAYAELLDARVMVDGTTASNTGTAIRKQINDLNDHLDEEIEYRENDVAELRVGSDFSKILKTEEIVPSESINLEVIKAKNLSIVDEIFPGTLNIGNVKADGITVLNGYHNDYIVDLDTLTINMTANQEGPLNTDMHEDTIAESGIFISTINKKPESSNFDGVKGTIYIDTDFLYVCVDSNTWKKVALLAI